MRREDKCGESGVEIGNIIGIIPFDKAKQGIRIGNERSEDTFTILVPIISGITGKEEVEATTYCHNGQRPKEVKKAYYDRSGRHIIGYETLVERPGILWADG